jgi:hypothetical protein
VVVSAGRTGQPPKSFEVETTCSKSVPPGGSCGITATFTPRAQDSSIGTVTIKNNASSKPMVVDLLGSGTVVEFSPASLTFATQKVGTKSAPQDIQVTNTGSTAVTFPGVVPIYIGFPDYNDFSETNNCGSTLAGGASCTVAVKFTPTKKGARNAVVNFNDSGGASPQLVPLTGTGS